MSWDFCFCLRKSKWSMKGPLSKEVEMIKKEDTDDFGKRRRAGEERELFFLPLLLPIFFSHLHPFNTSLLLLPHCLFPHCFMLPVPYFQYLPVFTQSSRASGGERENTGINFQRVEEEHGHQPPALTVPPLPCMGATTLLQGWISAVSLPEAGEGW